jgi:hypothetical protein
MRLWSIDGIEVVTASYVAQEVRRNICRDEHRLRFEIMMRSTLIVPDPTSLTLPDGVALPAKDVPVLAAALQARCDYLLASDRKDFGPYYSRNILGCIIQHPGAFLDLFPASASGAV